jgi:hypothetical protein
MLGIIAQNPGMVESVDYVGSADGEIVSMTVCLGLFVIFG